MNRDELKKRLQGHFTDGLVVIIGSGLSCAEGLPGMGDLSSHLLGQMAAILAPAHHPDWEKIADCLKTGMDLESAMLKCPPTPEVETSIVSLTSALILQHESRVVQEVFEGKRSLRLSALFRHLLKPPTGIPFITTNYDRLIEVAAEMAGLGVDCQFTGNVYGRFNPKESRFSFCRNAEVKRKAAVLSYCERINLSKPHGSLDWFQHQNDPIRCPFNVDFPRLIITPGRNKFRTGYDRPFDSHREKANRDIDKASRFLIIGYGFNDDHLETHLAPKIRDGTPALILTRSLSPKADSVVKSSAATIALSAVPGGAGEAAQVHTRDGTEVFDGANIWDLGEFISEVLEP